MLIFTFLKSRIDLVRKEFSLFFTLIFRDYIVLLKSVRPLGLNQILISPRFSESCQLGRSTGKVIDAQIRINRISFLKWRICDYKTEEKINIA